jgi:hypothetical protein
VAAQALRDLLNTEYAFAEENDRQAHPKYGISAHHVEGFCMKAVKVMEQAYRAPDAWVAEKLRDICTTE